MILASYPCIPLRVAALALSHRLESVVYTRNLSVCPNIKIVCPRYPGNAFRLSLLERSHCQQW